MSQGYRAVHWSPGKRVYDTVLAGLLGLYLVTFVGITFVIRPEITAETALIRAFGTAALLLLHLILATGPLTRLDRRFLPLLWNRRHLGVTMFFCALAHGAFALFQFHALGVENPLLSVWVSNPRYDSLAQFPFQPLGLVALVVLFLMAATSHDFWLTQLTAPVWKALHMSVYFAYALIVAHVALGALQDERSPHLFALLAWGVGLIVGLHLGAALRERIGDREVARLAGDGFVEIGRVDEIGEGRAKVATVGGERLAAFRYDGKISVVSNVCQHQNGPLGEGRILDGCITCPWHGYQYRPEDGCAPAPFTERLPTFRVRVVDGRVLVDPQPLLPGTAVAPARLDSTLAGGGTGEAFFVGYQTMPADLGRFLRGVVVALVLLSAGVAGFIASRQRPLGLGEYDYGVVSEVEGLLRLDPLPALWRLSAGGEVSAASDSRMGSGIEVVPLVGLGKHGPSPAILGLAGHGVRARGSWIRRGSERLFEVRSVEALAESFAAPSMAGQPLGAVTVRGEIVDSKCFLGVMKPGEGKSHRACAALCIAGGSPAAMVVRAASGETAVLWLVAVDGRSLGSELLDLVAEPVEVAGELIRLDGRTLLVTDRGAMRRL